MENLDAEITRRSTERVGCGGNEALMCVHVATKLDRIRNEGILRRTKVGEISKEVQENKLELLGV